MTPEQKQQLDDLKIRHRMAAFAFEGQEPPQAHKDIGFLLSLVKSQEALARELALIVDVGTGDDPGTELSKLHKIQHDAATSMRSRCVEIAENFRQRIQYENDEGMRESLFGDMVIEMESISLKEQKS